MPDECKYLENKTIKEISVDGYGVYIIFTDGTEFVYGASDGGYSDWSIIDSDGNEC